MESHIISCTEEKASSQCDMGIVCDIFALGDQTFHCEGRHSTGIKWPRLGNSWWGQDNGREPRQRATCSSSHCSPVHASNCYLFIYTYMHYLPLLGLLQAVQENWSSRGPSTAQATMERSEIKDRLAQRTMPWWCKSCRRDPDARRQTMPTGTAAGTEIKPA